MSNRSRRWLAGILLVGIALALVARRSGQWLVVDEPRPSDVILVLAGETERRPARALQLLEQGFGRKVVIDVPVAATLFTFRHIELAEKYVQRLPRAASISICPIEGLSTKDEARDAEKCLAAEHAGSVLIVTSDFHTRRALSIFRHELPGRSFSVAASYDEAQFGSRWWTHRQWAKTAVDEWLRLLWWTVVDRWR
jgi:uncharacterized SAM-binding protein YcdF (DUF218 family)